MTLQFADQDRIDQYEHVAQPFFADVLELDYGSCFVSDDSTLSDFSMACLPDNAVPENATYREACNIADAHIKLRVRERFGVEVEKTTVRLVDLFERIDAASRPVTLH